MAGRSPARFLAPIALVAFAVACYVVISHGLNPDEGNSNATKQERTASPTKTSGSHRRRHRGPRTYTVKSGDTASAIALKTKVSLSQLRKLNPKLDPSNLIPGQRLRLRR
jgi:LysM repeat protein